ncbi:MAG: DUF4433 domain-containing protein [Chlorobi bacterium]|nr:DUF4433 domain-containing protein [Chlorobiota bacterium]
MKGLSPYINFTLARQTKNFDASAIRFEKEKGLCVVADGTKNKGILSGEWASHLCSKTPFEPITTLKGFKLFVDTVWEGFYEETKAKIKDGFELQAFEGRGSFSTYAACWFRQEKEKTFFRWLSYGNSVVLVYNTKTDELFVPQYGGSLVGFLKNKGLINWKEDTLENEYFLSEPEQELTKHTKIILATDAMAEHLVLSYLIIRSKEDEYWETLSGLMQSDKKLSNLLFNNRGAYDFNSFDEVLEKWEKEISNNSLASYVGLLQQQNKIARDDLSLQVISYRPDGPEFTTTHAPVTNKTYPEQTGALPITAPPQIIIEPPYKKAFTYKKDKGAYIDLLLDKGVTRLYHFTDRDNLASIRQMGGLYSWEYLLLNNVDIPRPGSSQLSRMLDQRYALQNYVRTSFCKDHPMMHIALNEGRIHHAVLLEIDPVVVTFEPTLFSDMNATKNGHKRGNILKDLRRVKFDVCLQVNYFNIKEEEKPYYQAEVMVKEFIPEKYIMNINRI